MEVTACCLPPQRLQMSAASPGAGAGGRCPPLWRPWLPQAEEDIRQQREQTDTAWTQEVVGDGGPDKALAFFHHPVRLLWPKSKSFDYLYGVGEKLLENFPVQATLCLYEDSDSEEEEEDENEKDEEEDEEEQDAGYAAADPPPQAESPAKPV